MKILIVDDEITAIKDLKSVTLEVVPDAEIETADEVDIALEKCKKTAFDVIFMDVEMPGMSGIELSKEIKKIRPMVNIIMVTAYSQYTLDAIKLYVSDYILKPAMPEDIERALKNLRNPVTEENGGLYIQCFGNFEVFYDKTPIRFKRAKSKEMLAYLVDRRGASVTNSELRAVLWEDEALDVDKQMKNFATIAYELRRALDDFGCGDVVIHNYNAYSVDPDKFTCDYYQALNKKVDLKSNYEGEYMSQYSWAESRIGVLNDQFM